jgi:tetratricopeptide (TPR) repeat protein
VDVNCAAIPENLLEAELFGYERGAFTDARQSKPGLFQTAHRGTIFLDEVGLLPESLQAKLLKVLEERAVRRLGSTHSEPIDVWIVSATNADLAAGIHERRFREDLYHRLAVIPLRMPPLRERTGDVIRLAEHFLARACDDYGLPAKRMAADARRALEMYAWPGNIRELSNLMERVALLCDDAVVGAAALELPVATTAAPIARAPAPAPVELPAPRTTGSAEDAMREHLAAVLERTGWNISRSAEELGLSRNTVRARIERFGLRPSAEPRARGASPAPAPAPMASPGRVSEPRPPAPPPPAASAPPVPLTGGPMRWERRRLTFLRATLLSRPEVGTLTDNTRALETMMDKIRIFGGRVAELGSTWVGAIFGLEAVEDAPLRAVHAAMAIDKAVQRARLGEGDPLATQIGIHSAEVLVGQAGQGPEVEADAKRAAWSALEWMLEGAEAGALLVTPEAAPLLERRFELTRRGGAARGLRVSGREGRARAGAGLARFAGRRQELDLIRSRLDSARAGRGQLVGVVGEAGIGKSRLLREFRESLRGERVTYLEGHCLSYGGAMPYLPLLEILRRAFRLEEGDTPERIADKVAEALTALRLDPVEAAPYVLQMLGVKDGTDALTALGPEAVLARTTEILRQVAARASARRPLVVVVEDLHWIDAASLALTPLVESLAGQPILVILTYRPDTRPPWTARSHVTQIALQPLSDEESLSVVHAVLARGDVAEPLVRAIVARGEGNPFFLEELARALAAPGAAHDPAVIPAGVQDLLLARINRLPAPLREVLQAASVLGREISPRALQPMLQTMTAGGDDLGAALRELVSLDFLYADSRGGETTHVFRHALTHEVAYGSLLERRRRELHGRAGRALQDLYAGRAEEVAELLAHHFGRSDDADKAVDYAILAAERAQRRWANAEALAHFDAALARLATVPDSRANRLRRIDAVLKQAEVKFALGRHAEHIQALESIRGLVEAETAADPRRRAAWYYWTGFLHSLTGGRPEVPIAYCREASSIADAGGFDDIRAFAECCLAHVYGVAGNLRAAIEAGERALALFEAQGNVWWACRTLWVINTAALYTGDWERSLEYCRRGLAHGQATNDARLKVVGLWRTGSVHIQRGDWQAGLACCREAAALAPSPFDAATIKAVEGFGLVKAGRLQDGIAELAEAVAWFERSQLRYTRSVTALRLAEGHLQAGDRRRAGEILERIIVDSREGGYRHVEGVAERLLGECALPADRAGAARHLAAAERILTEVGARNELARTRMGQATLRHADGDLAGARALLREALETFEALGTLDGPPRVRALLAELEDAR